MTPSRNSTFKSDLLKWHELICCALVALGLHILLAFIFCKEQNGIVELEATGSRTNILFAENDPNFRGISQKIKAEPDPAQFIRGGSNGYSSCYVSETKIEPVSKNEITIPAEAPVDNTAEPIAPELNRSYAEILQYSPHAEKKESTRATGRNEAKYPIWKDAFGILQNFNPVYGAYNSTISINSSSVNSPTVLKIHFPQKKAFTLPPLVTIHTSCGDTFLDDYAKKILLERLANADFLKKFNPDYNDMVYIYWQPDLKAVETDSFPQNMFPGEKL